MTMIMNRVKYKLFLPLLILISGCAENISICDSGMLSGLVQDRFGNPVKDALVTIEGTGLTGVSDENGIYTISDVVSGTDVSVTASSALYPSKTIVIEDISFDRGVAYCDFSLDIIADIEGRVLHIAPGLKEKSPTPLEGVDVTYGKYSATTGKDGHFILHTVALDNTPVLIAAPGYTVREIGIKKDMYNAMEGKAILPDIVFSSDQLFTGLTIEQIRAAGLWRYDEYRGGRSTNWEDYSGAAYMSCLDFYNAWNEDIHGTIVKKPDNGSSPINGDDFYSYMYGRKQITEDNKFMTLNIRAAGENKDGQIDMTFGVQVMDLSVEYPTVEYVGDKHRIYNSDKEYGDFVFDLSKYVGKEVAIAVGIYCMDDGEHAWKQLLIRKMTFGPKAGNGLGTGFAVQLGSGDIAGLEGWHFSEEMRRAAMPCDLKTVNGLQGTLVDYKQNDGYHKLPKDHIARNWAVQYVKIAPEPLVGQGFMLKCKTRAATDFKVPQNYIYAKYEISEDCDEMTVKVGAVHAAAGKKDPAYFRVTVLDDEGSVCHLTPKQKYNGVNIVETSASVVQLPCSTKGDVVYDLSEYKGQKVIVIIGVYQGYEDSTNGQHRFCITSVNFQ